MVLLLCSLFCTGVDYNFTRSLDFTFRSNGPASLQLSFDLGNDLLVEGHEVAYLSLTQPMFMDIESDGAVLGTHSSTMIVINDDDGRKQFLSLSYSLVY